MVLEDASRRREETTERVHLLLQRPVTSSNSDACVGCVWSSIRADETCDLPIWKTSLPRISGKENGGTSQYCLVRRRYMMNARINKPISTIGTRVVTATIVDFRMRHPAAPAGLGDGGCL